MGVTEVNMAEANDSLDNDWRFEGIKVAYMLR